MTKPEWTTELKLWLEQLINEAAGRIEDAIKALKISPPPAAPGLDDRIWVTMAEAVRISGCSRQVLYKLINEGRIKSTTHGRKRLISRASIEALGRSHD